MQKKTGLLWKPKISYYSYCLFETVLPKLHTVLTVVMTVPLQSHCVVVGLIFLATLMAVVRVRQLYKRQFNGEPVSRPYIMFPNVQRCHADRDLRSCFKYLLNYGFYKFGIEVSELVVVKQIFCYRHLSWDAALCSLVEVY